jgi:hypothetical protein
MEPSMSLPETPRSSIRGHRLRRWLGVGLVAVLVLGLVGGGAVWVDAFGAGQRFERLQARVARFIAGPPPDRDTRPTVVVTAAPSAIPTPIPTSVSRSTPTPGATAVAIASPTPTPTPSPSPSPSPVRAHVDVRLPLDPKAVFASELHKDWCAPAGTQIVLAALGLLDTSERTQRTLAGRIGEWESWRDSHNGGWGPAAIALALDAYGAPGYEVRAYETRADALRGAAVALSETGAPVVLMTWRGAHTWVMSGYRADADPTIFPDAAVSGTYILDPWYPRISSIWGPSDPPGTFQDAAEMKRNYLPWKRPEGKYPDRDGRFIVVAPTIPVG